MADPKLLYSFDQRPYFLELILNQAKPFFRQLDFVAVSNHYVLAHSSHRSQNEIIFLAQLLIGQVNRSQLGAWVLSKQLHWRRKFD
jgi:hypothetical protein